MKKSERHDYILKRARELARSGECRDYRSVEIFLRGEGFEEARSILDNERLRDELDEMCNSAQPKKKP